MYGQGQALPPPQPSRPGVVVGLRVLFTALPLVSFGMLAWVSMLRLALLRKRSFDWLMLAVAGGAAVLSFTCLASSQDENADDWQANTGAALMLLCMFGTAVYFLVADIRRAHAERPGGWAPPAGYAQPNPYMTGPIPGGPGPGPGYPAGRAYAAPAPISGRTPPPVPARPATAPPVPAPHTPPPVPPRGSPIPTAGPRIDQVRAELDELSDYLRKEQGR